MSETKLYTVNDDFSKKAHIDNNSYQALYQQSITDPQAFWSEKANEFIDWFKPWDTVVEENFRQGQINWFSGATLEHQL